jgi:uncharacterized RDD family membrane protein YckC
VLGLRIAAALIDLALLFVLSVVLGVTIGEASVDGFDFSTSLNGAAATLFLVLVLLYYFALEATIGRTVGKLLLGLQVAGADGGRPSVWAVGIRTVARVVDWLPVLYFVGFVATLATGARRQRLGDLAAKTSVARGLPIRRRGLTAALVASSLILALVLSVVSVAVSGEEDTSTYRAHGVSFEYPADWQDVTDEVTFATEEGEENELWTVALGVSDVDIVDITAYRLTTPITADNLDAVEAEVTLLVRGLFEQMDGAVQDGPEEITMAGMPGLQYRGDGKRSDGTPIESTLTFAFDGTTEYFVNCQNGRARSAEIERGCSQVISTFEISEVGAAEPGPTSAEEQTSAEERWLKKIVAVRTEIDQAFLSSDPELTTSVMAELETAMRTCSRELAASGAPTPRLEPVYTIVENACEEYDKGAECFATAAEIGIPEADTAEDRIFTGALDCGFDAQGRGGELLVDAEIRGFEISGLHPDDVS